MVFRLQTYGLTLPGDAGVYAHGILKLPAMRAWSKAALIQPFREAGHEQEISELGECLEDLRS
jgi:glutathione S-transferase